MDSHAYYSTCEECDKKFIGDNDETICDSCKRRLGYTEEDYFDNCSDASGTIFSDADPGL